MAEKDTIFSSKISYGGIFSFKDFYQFCYQWLKEEMGLEVSEDKYAEKLIGNAKNIDVDWTGSKEVTDYFKVEVKVSLSVKNLENVEMIREGAKIKTNKGSIKVGIKGILVRDYQGKFDVSPTKQFFRGIYEKWVIGSRIEEMEGKVASGSDEFLNQAKAYLDLEGKK